MPYNIQLPDGTLVEGIPDEVDPVAAKQRILKARPDLFQTEPEPTKDTGFFDMMGRAVTRGAKQTGSLLADVLPAMAARAVGADEYAARQMAEAAETQKEIEQKYGARYKELSDVKGLGDVLPFVAETVAEQIPNIATAIVPGAGGAIAGGKLAAQQAAKTVAARQATKEVAEEAAKRYGAAAAAKGAAYGGGAGAFLGSYALNAPEVFQNIYEATKDEATGEGQMEVGASLLAGSVAAALDSILPAYLVKQFTPGMKAGVVEKILERSGMPAGVARGATAGIITGAATEAPTEAAQEAISIAAEKFVQENAPAWGSKEFNRLVEAGVRGGVGGGGISGVAGGVKGYMERPAKPKPEISTKGGTALDQIDQGEVEGEGPPDTSFDETGEVSTLQQIGAEEPVKKTPAAPSANLEKIQEVKAEIGRVSAAIRDLEDHGADEALLADWYAEREKLQAQERELRRQETPGFLNAPSARDEALRAIGMSEEEIQQRREAKGEPGVKYKPTSFEQSLTVEDLLSANIPMREAKAIVEQAGKNSLSGPARFFLNNLLQGKVLFPEGWRVPTEQDYADANEATRARFDRVQEIAAQSPQQFLLAQQQMGLDLTPAEEDVVRDFVSPIAMSEQAFQLTSPEGQVAGPVDIEAPEGPPPAPLNLVSEQNTNKLENLLNTLEGTAEADQGVKNYKSAVRSFLNEIRDYIAGEPAARKENLGLINDFFNSLGLTSDAALASNLQKDLKGKTSAQQAEIIAQRTRMPKINTLSGINQLRDQFQDYMEQQALAGLGQPPALAATTTFSSDIYIPKQVAAILRQLRNKPTKSMSPEEKAFMAYMSKFKYGLAMRSAAYDLANNVPNGTMFSNQGAKQAKLFQKFIEDNLPAQIFESFNNEVQANYTRTKVINAKLKRIAEMKKRRVEYLRQKKAERKEVTDYLTEKKKAEEELERTDLTFKYAKELSAIEEAKQPKIFNANSPQGVATPIHPAIEARLEESDIDGALELIEQMPGPTYWKLLATRLRAANLDTTMQIDAQERLVRSELARISPSVNNLVQGIQIAYPEVYAAHIAPAINSFTGEIDPIKFTKGLRAIKKNGLLSDNIIHSSQVVWILDRYSNAVESLDAPGFYSPQIDTINLNRKEGGVSYYALFHELTHAATAHAILNPDKLDTAQKKALDNLYDLWNYTKDTHPAAANYGLQSLDEFIAEAFTNTDFQALLGSIPYKNSDTSIWSKFIEFVRKLLGGKDTVLFGTLANADILMSATQARSLNANRFTGNLMTTATAGKRTTLGTFKTAPDVQTNWLNSVLNNRPGWEQSKNGVKRFLENITDATRKYYLGAFTLRQLQDLIGTRLGNAPSNFINSIENMLEEHNKIVNEAKEVTEMWSKYQSKNPEGNDRLSLLMIDTTLAGIDPDRQKGEDTDFDNRWDTLDDEGKKIYRAVRDFYDRRIRDYKDTLLKNTEMSLLAKGVPAQEIAAKLRQISSEFDRETIGPYFPLKRFGQYWIQVGKGKDKEFYMFGSAAERNAAKDMLRADMAKAKDTRTLYEGNSLREVRTRGLQDISMLETIEKIIDDTAKQDYVMQSTFVAGKGLDTYKEALKDNLEELYILTLPNKSIRKNFLTRKGVSGASKDMLRAFSDSSSRMAYQHARFKFSRDMFSQLDAANQVLQANVEQGKEDTKVDRDYLVELERRLEYVMNPTDTGGLPTAISNVSFIWYLTAPASALINMLGLPAIGLPVLAARYGKTKSAAALLSNFKRFMSSGFKDKNGNWAMPSLNMADLSPTEKAAYDVFAASGLVDITQAYDLSGLAESPSNMYTGRMSTVMRGLSFMFHHAERFNREVMAMSAFNMAYERETKKGVPAKAAFDKAIAEAKDLTYRAMFDYSTLNKPRYLQNSLAKIILQFKQFPQQMTFLLVNSGMQWFSKNNPELREEVAQSLRLDAQREGRALPIDPAAFEKMIDDEVTRICKEGRDRLLGTLGMTFLFAGATGMPLFSVGASVIEALYAVFSDDDEPPLDFENWFKNWMAMTFGDFWGDSISRGLATQATGMNFADRMSLNDLWFRDSRKSQDEVTAFQNMLINLLGPTAALGVQGAEALKLFNDGHYYRGLERSLPAVFKQPLTGMRYATEGALTLKGDELISQSELSAKDALAQSLGFSPEKVAQRQKANIEEKTAEQEIKAKRQDLLNAFFLSIDTADTDLTDRVIEKITRFNSMHPGAAITDQTLLRSLDTRYEARALAELSGGIPIDKNLMAELDDMRYYGR